MGSGVLGLDVGPEPRTPEPDESDGRTPTGQAGLDVGQDWEPPNPSEQMTSRDDASAAVLVGSIEDKTDEAPSQTQWRSTPIPYSVRNQEGSDGGRTSSRRTRPQAVGTTTKL